MITEAGTAIQNAALRLINDASLRSDIVKPYADCVRSRDSLDIAKVDAAVVERYSETVLEWVKVRATEIVEAEKDRARTGDGEEASDG